MNFLKWVLRETLCMIAPFLPKGTFGIYTFGLSAGSAALLAAGIGAAGSLGSAGISAMSAGKGGKMQSFNPKPYSGPTPPSVGDSFRPVQDLTTKTLMRRSQGEDVGYAPSWIDDNMRLINRGQTDRLRNSAGALSASGLSGNPRAYEATSGRIQRDTGDQIAQLGIANAEKKANQTEDYTKMLGSLNAQNFGQENNVADFGKSVWGAENGMNLSSAQLGTQQGEFGQNMNQQVMGDVGKGVGGAAGALSSMLRQPGTGIVPTGVSPTGGFSSAAALNQAPQYLSLVGK